MSVATPEDLSLSNLSLSPSEDDWDRSASDIIVNSSDTSYTTPRNSVLFPGNGEDQQIPVPQAGKRTISELLKVYAEKGTNVQFSLEEASRVADVLGQWINSESSPYEAEDDFFRSQDDSSISAKRSSFNMSRKDESLGRPRGSSESRVNSRPASRTAAVQS